MSKLPVIGITMGDMNGIAPEVIIKALSDTRINNYCTPVVFGSPRTISFWKKIIGLNDFQLHIAKSIDQINVKRSNILVCWEEEVEIKVGEPTDLSGKYAFKSLQIATQHALEGKIDALVTAPLNKHNINNELLPFKGHTGYLAQMVKTQNHLMLLVSQDLKVGLVTGHIPVSEISQKLTAELLERKILAMMQSLKNDFGITKPRLAILGLNPHAGENGLLGNEEKDIIVPVIESLKEQQNLHLFGPYPADGFFGSNQHTKFDGVLAMYHDQGLIPFKSISFSNGVNFTAGLPFVRTSPDHGTAYGIAGKNLANEESFRNAIYMAIDLWANRVQQTEIAGNSLPITPMKRERFRIDF